MSINHKKFESDIKCILERDDEDELSSVYATFASEIATDDEPYDKKGRAILNAYLSRDPDEFCMALTGWTFHSLLARIGMTADTEGVTTV